MTGVRFEPQRLTSAAGDTIEWVNDDLVPHTASAADSSWDSGDLPPGARWRITLARAGRVPYGCRYHPTMTGEIEVR